MNPSFYTQAGVYLPLAAKLPVVQPDQIIASRFSKSGDEAGAAGQRDATFKTLQGDPDVALLRQIPEEAWDPKRPDVGQVHGVTWLHLDDLHDSLHRRTPVAAVVARGRTVFLSLMLSATDSHIVRPDGSRENGATWLYVSLLNHYVGAKVIRWAEDLNRAARSKVGWALVMDTCLRKHTRMGFGHATYSLSDQGDRITLGVLTTLTSEDDMARRMHLTGKRVAKLDAGGAAVPVAGMPRGWVHAEDQYGRRVKDNNMGFVPLAVPAMAPVLQELYTRYARGATYQSLAPLLTEFEEQGLVVRRDPCNPGNSYKGLSSAGPGRKHDAVMPFFYIKESKPAKAPTLEAIEAYLSGAAPEDVFDIPTRLYIARIELVRTGFYFRRLQNDIVGIGEKGVDGYIPEMSDDEHEKGAFYVVSERWPWPTGEDGKPLERFGVPDDVLRKCAARMLKKLHEPRRPKGGRNRRDGQRRLLQNLQPWTVPVEDDASRYADGPTQWGVRARTQKSGKNIIRVMHRPAHETGEWKYLPGAASASLAEVLQSVSTQLDRRARLLLDPAAVATVRLTDPEPEPTRLLDREVKKLAAEVDGLEETNKGLRAMAAIAQNSCDMGSRDKFLQDAGENDSHISIKQADIAALQLRVANLQAQPSSNQAEGDLNVWAYLVVVLERAAKNHGVGSYRDGQLCDRTFESWRFVPEDESISWSCTAQLPLTDGTTAAVPLSGRVRNISAPRQEQRGQMAHDIFAEGLSVDEVATRVGCRRRAVYDRYVMPWLRDNGITATGAKCSLVDHPLGMVRQVVWAVATKQDTTKFAATRGYVEAITELYFDPKAAWGGTAVPDDTTRTQRALNVLASSGVDRLAGLAVRDLAQILECTEKEVRDLARPRARKYGFIRPRFLEYTGHQKDRVRLLTCPHDGEAADHVAFFLEVAASGYGVLCRTCRRTPNSSEEWTRRSFPEWYVVTSWTHVGGKGSIMESPRTVAAARER